MSPIRLSLLGAIASGKSSDVWHVVSSILTELEIGTRSGSPLLWCVDEVYAADRSEAFNLYAVTAAEWQRWNAHDGALFVTPVHDYTLTLVEIGQVALALLDAADHLPLQWLPSSEVAPIVESAVGRRAA